MNKTELVDTVASQLDASRAEAARAVDAVLAAITDGLRAGDKVTIAGFGTFQKKSRAARMGTKPGTGEKIQIPASTTCSFKPAQALKERL